MSQVRSELIARMRDLICRLKRINQGKEAAAAQEGQEASEREGKSRGKKGGGKLAACVWGQNNRRTICCPLILSGSRRLRCYSRYFINEEPLSKDCWAALAGNEVCRGCARLQQIRR